MTATTARAVRPATWTGRAWSCTIRLVVTDPRVLTEAVVDLNDLLGRVESAASRFLDSSALSVANARAGRPVAVPALLVKLVSAALTAAERTDGAVDPTVGRIMCELGYDDDIGWIEKFGPAVSPQPAPASWRAVRLDRSVGLLTVPVGTALDLGATAKAFTADLAARTLARRYSTNVLVELGGDVAVAGAPGAGWPIRVAEREGDAGPVVLVRRGGIATSTTTIRQWTRGGQRQHHIVDPRTGAPANGPWRTVSVYAASALDANTASTAAIVMGYNALPWLREHGYCARLVGRDGNVATTASWPSTRAHNDLSVAS
jgi:FAD:protein FMN transferase